jgi:hypothetical protein
MESRLRLEILPQPDDYTCGPTCLHAVYRYYGDNIALDRVIAEVGRLDTGGTFAVLLGCHALARGYSATIYTYNLEVFDPTWFSPNVADIPHRLRKQAIHKPAPRLQAATRAYLEFIERGGRLEFRDLKAALIRRYLLRERPILTGCSATYLYRCAREFGPADEYDDIRGEPSGHFVVLSGYNRIGREVLVSDPMVPNPAWDTCQYWVNVDRVICAILLGTVTHDANLLIVQPREREKRASDAHPDRGQ